MTDENKYDLRAIFQRIELDLIASLKRTFLRHKKEEQEEGFRWEQWQLAKLKNLVKFRKNNKQIIDEYSKPISEAVEHVLKENFNTGEKNVDIAVNKVKNTLEVKFPKSIEVPESKLEMPDAGPEESFFGMNEKKLNAMIETVDNDLKEGQKAVLRKMDDVYRQVIYKAEMHMTTGAKTLNQAVDMATKDFLKSGINCIEYSNNRRANIASYAEMCLRTASQRATFLGEGKKRDKWGTHLVVVSAHANTCELCAPWQGKVLIDDVYSHPSKEYIQEYSRKYSLLSQAMKEGLLHPNCRHTLATFFLGITKLPEVPKDEEITQNYKVEQKQRYLERQIRKWKRVRAGSLDPDNLNKAADKVKEYQKKLREHLEENTQLRRATDREK